MKKHSTYSDLAKYYDFIYQWKNYKLEAKKLRSLISRHKKSKGKDLLDVACGTGEHFKYLKSFSCMGMDLNQSMLNIAKHLKSGGVVIIEP